MSSNLAEKLYDLDPKPRPAKLKNVKSLKKVLIIEDDASLAVLFSTVLEDISAKIQVDWATSGEEAKYYLENEVGPTCPYDLIIADIFLEGNITGLDIWKLCDEKYPEVNILVTSSLSTKKFFSYLKNEDSCPTYLPKPFTLSTCKKTFEKMIT